MSSLQTIYCIHAGDSPQHLGKIQQLFEKFKAEKRLDNYVMLLQEQAQTVLPQKVEENDIMIVLLTTGLKLSELVPSLSQLKSKIGKLAIAQVIIDNVTYEKAFIVMPGDLEPIRTRENMDAGWQIVENSISDLLKGKPANLKKYLIPIGGVILLALLVWVATSVFMKNPEPNFSYKIRDIKTNTVVSDKTDCYLPCLVSFYDDSKNADKVEWVFEDTTINEKNTDHLFVTAGEHEIRLNAISGSKSKSTQKKLLVKAPPFADFDVKNDGCIAPCEIEFTSKSKDMTSYGWNFGDNTQSAEPNPKKQYASAGVYAITFTVTNSDNLKKDTTKNITVRADQSPFAEFTVEKTGIVGSVPRVVNFNNQSKNADQFIWDFGDGHNGTSTSSQPVVSHTYTEKGSFTVVLTAKQANKESNAANSFMIGPWENVRHIEYVNKAVLESIEASPTMKKRTYGPAHVQP